MLDRHDLLMERYTHLTTDLMVLAPLEKWHIIYTNKLKTCVRLYINVSKVQRYWALAATIHPMMLSSSFISIPNFFKPQVLGRTNLFGKRKCSTLPCCASTSTNVSQRKSANYQQNIWNYDTLQSLKNDYTVI
jgi:hypothetical protein